MLGINARVEDLRLQIINDINAAKMPACILDYILTEILNDVRTQRISEVQKERDAFEAEKRVNERPVPVRGEVPDGNDDQTGD